MVLHRLYTKRLLPLLAFILGMLATQICFAQSAQEEYALTSSFYSRGQWHEAIDGFSNLIDRYPNSQESAPAHFFLAESKMQVGEHADAFNSYQRFLQIMPKHNFAPRATFRLGEAAYRLKRFQQATRLLEDFVMDNPKDPLCEFALPFLGEIRLKRGEPQLAQRAYETALNAFPNSRLSEKCRLGLAKALQSQGANEEAMRFYRFIIETPGSRLAGQARLQLGMNSFAQNDYVAARNQLGEAMAQCVEPESQTQAAYWLARTEFALHNHQRAVKLFDSALNIDGDSALRAVILYDGAVAALEAEELETARAWLEGLRSQYPDSEWADDGLFMQIELANKEGRSEDALELTRRFKNEYENSPLLLRIFETEGRIFYQNRNYAESVKVFETLLAESTGRGIEYAERNRATWRYWLSLAHIGNGELKMASGLLARIDLTNESEKLVGMVELARGSAFNGLKNYPAAISAYRNFLVLQPNGEEAFYARADLAVALGRIGRWNESRAVFEKLRNENIDQKIITETATILAEAAYTSKEDEHAEYWYTLLSQAGESQDTKARGLSGLAWVKMQSDQSESALSFFERLLKEYPDSDYAIEAAMARAKFLDESRKYQDAAEMYGLVIERFSDTKFAHAAMLRRAYALQQVGGKTNLRTAKELLTDYIQLPGKVESLDEAIYQLAWVYHDSNLASHGREKFKTIVTEYPNSKYWPDAAFRLAQFNVQQKNFDQAKVLLDELLVRKAPPEILTRVLYLQGQIAAERNNWSSVVESMKQLVGRTDDGRLKSKAKYWLAEALYQQEAYTESESHFNDLQQNLTQLDSSLVPWIFLRRTQCLGQSGDWETALSLASEGKARFTSFGSAYEFDFIRGRALAHDGKFNDAVKAFEAVVASPKGGPTETAAIAQWRIGEAYFHQEKYVAAIKAFYRVESLYAYPKWRAAALMQAGKCQEHLGNWSHAVTLYRQLLKDFPKSEFVGDATKRLKTALENATTIAQSKEQKTKR